MQEKRRFLSLAALFIHFYIIHACEKYNFVKEEDVELKDHVITTMTTPYVEICWDKCVWIMYCFSINVRANSFGTFECDLNNSSKTANPGSLVPTQGSQYHYMTDSDVCVKHGCTVIKDDIGDGWYRVNNAVMKVFHQNKTWLDARTHCQSLGSDLVSITTAYQNVFIRDVFINHFNSTRKKRGDDLPGLLRYWPLDGSDGDIKLKGDSVFPRYEFINRENTLYFPGIRTYAEIPAVVFNPEGFTFMLWVKPANQSKDMDTIYSDWQSPHFFMLSLHRTYKSIFFWIDSEEGKLLTTYYLSISTEYWNHITVAWNKTAQLVKIALNGTWKQDTSTNLTSDIKRTAHTIYHLGVKSDELPLGNDGNTFHGHMKHLMVFNKTLTIEEVQKAMYYVEQGPWIGLNIPDTNSSKWSDGTSKQFMAVPPTKPNPSLSGRKCFSFGKNGNWINTFCNETIYFICGKPFP